MESHAGWGHESPFTLASRNSTPASPRLEIPETLICKSANPHVKLTS